MATVGLVSCVSRKRAQATDAQDLYESPLFLKARDYVEQTCDRWFILSAKHGLVAPQQVIEPYEETLNTKSRAERRQWADAVWRRLRAGLHCSDRVVVLAGAHYREYLVPRIKQHGCVVDVPMEGLGIGQQLHWLTRETRRPRRGRDAERLYASVSALESGVGGKRLLRHCSGQQGWPRAGVYLFFEEGEDRVDGSGQRVVRVGTHGVSHGSKATLWNRLRTHRGTANGLGNHRSSIFRLHVGAALAARDAGLDSSSWGVGQAADAEVRRREQPLERAVSCHIGSMRVLWLAVQDDAGPASDRAYLERNLIGLLAGRGGPVDPPSDRWLGRSSPDERIRQSGLWNLDFLDYSWSHDFLAVFHEYVKVTIGSRPQPNSPLAPRDWYLNERQGVSSDQLSQFEE